MTAATAFQAEKHAVSREGRGREKAARRRPLGVPYNLPMRMTTGEAEQATRVDSLTGVPILNTPANASDVGPTAYDTAHVSSAPTGIRRFWSDNGGRNYDRGHENHDDGAN